MASQRTAGKGAPNRGTRKSRKATMGGKKRGGDKAAGADLGLTEQEEGQAHEEIEQGISRRGQNSVPVPGQDRGEDAAPLERSGTSQQGEIGHHAHCRPRSWPGRGPAARRWLVEWR
jgi:hypothetical protein